MGSQQVGQDTSTREEPCIAEDTGVLLHPVNHIHHKRPLLVDRAIVPHSVLVHIELGEPDRLAELVVQLLDTAFDGIAVAHIEMDGDIVHAAVGAGGKEIAQPVVGVVVGSAVFLHAVAAPVGCRRDKFKRELIGNGLQATPSRSRSGRCYIRLVAEIGFVERQEVFYFRVRGEILPKVGSVVASVPRHRNEGYPIAIGVLPRGSTPAIAPTDGRGEGGKVGGLHLVLVETDAALRTARLRTETYTRYDDAQGIDEYA